MRKNFKNTPTKDNLKTLTDAIDLSLNALQDEKDKKSYKLGKSALNSLFTKLKTSLAKMPPGYTMEEDRQQTFRKPKT